jgi:hypothetical protein
MRDTVRPRRWSDPRFDRPFFLGISVVFLALVFWTFARTFYLKAFFATPVLTPLVHFHGIVMSGWVVLLVVQSSLIAAHRVRWHRRVGVFGAGWAVLLVILGSVTTVHAAAREVRGHTPQAAEFVIVMGLDLLQMILFAAYVGAAIWLRRRPDYHKRLMLLTIACMLPDALARLPVSFMTDPLILLGINVFVILCVGIDTVRHRRLHPAFGWGGGAFIAVFNVALPAFAMSGWVALASRWLS